MAEIYKITSPTNKIYIGQSVNVYKRIAQYKRNHCKGQTKLYNSLLKHGWLNHKFEILAWCDDSSLNELELYYSELYNSTNSKTGLNIRQCGGSKGKLSEETKQKISKANIGKLHSEITKQKIRDKRKFQVFSKESLDKLKGKKPWNKGVPQTKEVKDKLHKANKGKIGVNSNGKIIFQYDGLNNLLKKYYGAREVERETGFKCAVINRAARGERSGKAYGFKWKYE